MSLGANSWGRTKERVDASMFSISSHFVDTLCMFVWGPVPIGSNTCEGELVRILQAFRSNDVHTLPSEVCSADSSEKASPRLHHSPFSPSYHHGGKTRTTCLIGCLFRRPSDCIEGGCRRESGGWVPTAAQHSTAPTSWVRRLASRWVRS